MKRNMKCYLIKSDDLEKLDDEIRQLVIKYMQKESIFGIECYTGSYYVPDYSDLVNHHSSSQEKSEAMKKGEKISIEANKLLDWIRNSNSELIERFSA